jgi:sugar phosphate isomerase/epimerase
MRLPGQADQHLTYCLNIHPGETWSANLASIRTHALDVRDRVSHGRPFGLGMRLGAQAAAELLHGNHLTEFKALLAEEDLYVFTINGFPYGPFHGTPVKQKVYAPDWRESARVDYTCRLADILSQLLPDDVAGTISTVPGSYKSWITDARDEATMIENLVSVAGHLYQIHNEAGPRIELCLEPEPDCYLETSHEAIAFFNGPLFTQGVAQLDERFGCGDERAAEILRNHLGICLDTCHMALQFENPTQSLRAFQTHGIRVSKIQISAALEVTPRAQARARLKPFDEPVYLHQVKCSRNDASISSFPDLPHALASKDSDAGEIWRIHFHVPLYWDGSGELATTHDGVDSEFFDAAREAGVEHLEIETYTFDVLPDELRDAGVSESIAREYDWVRSRINAPA